MILLIRSGKESGEKSGKKKNEQHTNRIHAIIGDNTHPLAKDFSEPIDFLHNEEGRKEGICVYTTKMLASERSRRDRSFPWMHRSALQ